MAQMNPIQWLMSQVSKSPPPAGPGIPSGNAPDPMALLKQLLQPKPSPTQPQPSPPPGQMPGLSPQMIMQLLQMFGGKSQPMQVPDAATQKVINPMVNR